MNPSPALLAICIALWASSPLAVQAAEPVEGAPTSRDWLAIAALPDWSGVWIPDVIDQGRQNRISPPPWNAKASKEALALAASEAAGHPKGLFVDCLPNGMPSLMLVTHNAIEFVFTPGRVLLLGESDGNRQRRIYTDGRGHPHDPDPSFFGHSIGHWERDTLVVDTVGVFPETYLAISEAVGIANNGEMHIIERIHLTSNDALTDELTIEAPHTLAAPWKTTRTFYRRRARKDEFGEGVCLQGKFAESADANGDAVFVPMKFAADGSPLPPTP